MKQWQGVAINGAIFGAIFGAGYHLYAHRSGGWAAAMNNDLLIAVLIGAAAGALAFLVRRSTR